MDNYFVFGRDFDGEKSILGAFVYEETAVEEARLYSLNRGYVTTFVTGPKGFYKSFFNTALQK